MAKNPTLIKLLDKIRETHEKKNSDYTEGDSDPYQNFKRASIIVSWFKKPEDQVFAALIGIKLARIASLRNSNKTPANESLEDSYLDATVYSAIWKCFVEDDKDKYLEIVKDSELPTKCYHQKLNAKANCLSCGASLLSLIGEYNKDPQTGIYIRKI